jgi:hypothetical protein
VVFRLPRVSRIGALPAIVDLPVARAHVATGGKRCTVAPRLDGGHRARGRRTVFLDPMVLVSAGVGLDTTVTTCRF